jgi:hypothetical protein
MRIFILLIIFCFIIHAQKRFTSDYFVSKYNLSLPEVTKEMLDISDLTHTSDLWEYYYKGKTDKLDSAIEDLTIERFPYSRAFMVYTHKGDTAIERLISINLDSGDTLSNWIITYINNFRYKSALDLETNCIWKSHFDELGIKLQDVRKCPDENNFDGQIFNNTKHDDYIESIETYQGKIDSNSIRRYYLTPFDSIVADFMVKKGKDPFIVNLNVYNNKRKKQYSYGFGIFYNINEVLSFNYYTYTDKNQLHRSYYFDVIDRKAKDKHYELVNYTEYEYDSLGRKIRVTTRVKPAKKSQIQKIKKNELLTRQTERAIAFFRLPLKSK